MRRLPVLFLLLAAFACAASPGGQVRAEDDSGAQTATSSAALAAGVAEPATLFLTWAGDPATSITALWLGAKGDGSDEKARFGLATSFTDRVRVRPRGGEAWTDVAVTTRPLGDTALEVHEAQIIGLSPATVYELQTSAAGTRAFRTQAESLDAPLVFAAGGDAGPGKTNRDVCTAAAKSSPAFAVIGGDVAYANAVRPERWATFLREWNDHMITPDGITIPMVVVVGNHEVRGGYGKTRAEAPYFYSLFASVFPGAPTYRTHDVGDYLSLVMLDSGHTLPVRGAQTAWLAKALAARAAKAHLFAVYHVPAYPSHRERASLSSPAIRAHWVPLFEAHGVDVCFENNDHTYKRTHLLKAGRPNGDGVLYIGDGCWGRGPRALLDPESSLFARSRSVAHHLRVTLFPDGGRLIEAIDRKGELFDRWFARAR